MSAAGQCPQGHQCCPELLCTSSMGKVMGLCLDLLKSNKEKGRVLELCPGDHLTGGFLCGEPWLGMQEQGCSDKGRAETKLDATQSHPSCL